MKKIISILLAVLLPVSAVCAGSVTAFAKDSTPRMGC